jgi:hypothetical protein
MYSHLRALAQRKHEEWHSRRADLFVALMQPRAGATVLDLGGDDGAFANRLRARVDVRVTVADIGLDALERARSRGFETAELKETEGLPFPDRAFDFVFCNSVIEHVTAPKADCITRRYKESEWVSMALEHQSAFARELTRIAGGGYFVQTPHRMFPIEAHTWLPGLGWLPHQMTVSIVRITDRVWVKRCGYVDWNLLTEPQMRRLFPGAMIHVERAFGFPKSLVAYART